MYEKFRYNTGGIRLNYVINLLIQSYHRNTDRYQPSLKQQRFLPTKRPALVPSIDATRWLDEERYAATPVFDGPRHIKHVL